MRIDGLNHFNIIAADMAQLHAAARFYEQLGLQRGNRPDFGNTGIWLYIYGKPIVHLNIEEDVGPIARGRGTVHHLGFDVRGTIKDVTSTLDQLGIKWRLWPTEVPGWFRALYFDGPCGEEIEFVLIDNPVPAAS